MSYSSFDPRKTIIQTIGTSWYDEEEGDYYVIPVTDNNGDTVRIPIKLSEEIRTESVDELPYIEMTMVYTSYEPNDIGASTRKMETYIDCHLYFTDTDNIDTTNFGKDVMDKMQDLIRSKQITFESTNKMFVNIGEVRYIREPKAHQVVFHYVFEIYAIYYDIC